MDTFFNLPPLDNAVAELAKLPGVGRKTALRLALHLLRQDDTTCSSLAEAIVKLKSDTLFCSRCHNLSETSICGICSDSNRDAGIICVVENVNDVLAIESTREHKGLYHVLGGLISPLDGIAPSDIEIASLIERVQKENAKEVILALSPTMEGDTTSFYIYKNLSSLGVEVSTLARGIAVGNDLEYTDELTLARSIHHRIPFNSQTK